MTLLALAFALALTVLNPAPARAAEAPDLLTTLHELENTVGRPLTDEEIARFRQALQWNETALGSTVLLCARAEVDVYVGVSISACVDIDGTRYYLAAAGAGFALGVGLSAFTIIYHAASWAGVIGTYYGGKASAAIGPWGGVAGLYFRRPSDEGLNRGSPYDRLYWLGYMSGASIDVSVSVLHIGLL